MIIDEVRQNELATPKDWGLGKSKQKGTEYVWMEFLFPELAGDGGGEVTITHRWYLTEKTIDFVLRDLSLLGWNGTDITECQKGLPGSHNFTGATCRLTTKWDKPWTDDKGEQHDKMVVAFVNPVDYKPKTLDEKEVKAVNMKLRGKIAAYRAKNAPPVKSTGKPFKNGTATQTIEDPAKETLPF